jgi:hypothetical protein
VAKHRRRSHTRSTVFDLPAAELTAISADLQHQMPSTPPAKVDAAIRHAVHVLSGLDTAPHHVSTLVRRRAETTLDESP